MPEIAHEIPISTIWSNLSSDEIRWLIDRLEEADWLHDIYDQAYDSGYENGRLEESNQENTDSPNEPSPLTPLEQLVEQITAHSKAEIRALPDEDLEYLTSALSSRIDSYDQAPLKLPKSSLLDEVKLLTTLVCEAHPNDSVLAELKLLINSL